MDEVRVIATAQAERLYTVENGTGDQFTFRFPTRDRQASTMEGPPVWKRGSPPESDAHAQVFKDIARRVAMQQAIRDGIVDP